MDDTDYLCERAQQELRAAMNACDYRVRQVHLVLVQHTLPFAPPSALFSDGLVYRFRLRPLALSTTDGDR